MPVRLAVKSMNSPAGDLEGAAVVVEFVLLFPEHAIADLPGSGGGAVGQAQILLFQGGEVRGEDHAAGVAGPAAGIQPGIVFRQEGIAGIAEDAFHEVQIAHQHPRGKKADLHGLLRQHSGHLRADDGAQQQTDKGARLFRVRQAGGVGQGQQVGGRIQRRLQ